MASGAADYNNVFTLVGPSLTSGAPDWEQTAVAPGGGPLAGGAGGIWPASMAGLLGWTLPGLPLSVLTDPYNYLWLDAVTFLSTPVSKIWVYISGPGTHLTANENYVGLYQPTFAGTQPGGALSGFTLLGTSAAGAAEAAWSGAVGWVGVALTAPVTVTPGALYYIAHLWNGNDSFNAAMSSAAAGGSNILGGANFEYFATGHTTLPASLALAQVGQNNEMKLVGAN